MAFVSLNRKRIPLKYVVPEEVFILLSISPLGEFVEGKPTGKTIGYNYLVVDTNDFDKYSVKIKDLNPLMGNDELQKLRESGEKVLVEFQNASVYMYWDNKSHDYRDSFSADSVALVKST